MKLRIHGNSVRLRLNQAEVAQFSKTGFVEEAVEFGPGARLSFSLECLSQLPDWKVIFENSWLRIQMPSAPATQWATTDQVGVSAEQQLGDGKRLSILIEKDFQCAHSPEPQDPYAYPNPLNESSR